MSRDFWGDPYNGARHPDAPEPRDRTDREPDDINKFDPQDDADLGVALPTRPKEDE